MCVSRWFMAAAAALAGGLGLCASASAQGNVVISQYYGGGGFQAAGPVFDCIELFNRTGNPINLSGWSLQVVASSAWQVIPLTGTIPARGYYLIRTGASFDVNVGVPLTFDDSANPLIDTSAFTSGSGRAALIRNTTSIGASTVCPIGLPDTEDVLSVGSTTCAEGGAGAPGGSTAANPPTNTVRKLSGCQDTDNNGADFELLTPPAMRNSSSPPLPGSNLLVGNAGTNPVNSGSSTILTVNSQACGGSPLSLTSVTANLTAFGLTSAEAFTGSGSGPWTYTLNVPGLQATNTYTINLGGTDGTSTISGTLSVRVVGPPPPNDLCANAVVLGTLPVSVGVDNSTATADLDPGTCNTGLQGNFGVWYRYDATQSGILTINETSAQTAAVGVWVTPTSGATCPASGAASTCSTATSTQVVVLPGNTYFIQVGSSGTTTPTVALALDFSFTAVASPSNDTCENATVLSTLPQTFVVDNRLASDDLDPGTCNTGTVGNRGVWFRFDATSVGTLNLNETSTQVVAYGIWATPTAGAICPTAGAATTCSTTQNLNVTTTPGTTFFIQVGASTATLPTVPMNITFTFFPPPANDECTGAIALQTGLSTINNTSATTSAAPFNSVLCPTTASSFFNDVWYKWTAPASGRFALVSNFGIAGRYALYDGGAAPGTCPSAATPIQCQSTSTAVSNDATTPIAVVGGNVYYIQFGTTVQTTTPGNLELEITFDPDASGSCCVATACTVLAPAACTGAGGTYGGDGSLCSTSAGSIDAYAGAGGAIVDFNSTTGVPGGFTSSIVVPDAFVVNDVEVEINFTHTFNGDLTIRLSKDGRVHTLHGRGRRGMSGTTNTAADFSGVYRWNDLATSSIFDVLATGAPTAVPAASYRPAGTGGLGLSMKEAFNGIGSAGTWTLSIVDYQGSDVGTVTGWVLRLTRGNAAPCNATPGVCCRGATCTTTVTQASCVTSGTQWGAAFSTASASCGTSATTPCCHGDYDKAGGVQVADIFAYLNDWFASSPFADFAGDGTVTPDVADIFSFLNAWFAGGC
ncbi:MAG: lamin tail domain-containing protein [Phycisphaerales bacterium]|nr:lamin tail domain-containing protein [Phycisphaerales bacterium]